MKARSDAVFVLILLLLAVLYLSFLIANGLILCGPQQFFLEHPMHSLWLSQFFSGHLPWISNAVSGGIPLWADPNLAIFYPGNFIYLILPFDHAWNASLIFHLLWGTAGVYWLCREFKLPVSASLTGAFAFLFSSPALTALNSNEVLITSSWLPWIFGLTYFGLQSGVRRIFLASVAVAFQWLGGFSFIQAFTLFVIAITLIVVYLRTRVAIVYMRFLLLIVATVLITAIQWIPAVLWIPHSNAELGFSLQQWKVLPYLGFTSGVLFLLGLRNRFLWWALMGILVDWLVLGWTPISSICLAIGAAKGAAEFIRKFDKPVFKLIPALVLIELLFANLHVPQMLSLFQIQKVPSEVMQIRDMKLWNLHCSAIRSTLYPLAGLHWGVKYDTPPEHGLMLWKTMPARKRNIEEILQTGKSMELFREAAIGYVISDRPVHHPELRLIRQEATRFFVHRLKTPVYPPVRSSDGKVNVRLLEVAPNHLVIETASSKSMALMIYRNALPGWKCTMEKEALPIDTVQNGWMQIHAPAGKNKLHLIYRTPGSLTGTILTALGTILVLAIFLLL
jgi:hypothetical protein